MGKTIKIGGASGYWGESAMATPQLLGAGNLDYLVYDYLAEITMSIMARMKIKDPARGYATDFIDFVMKPFLPQIARQGVKIIANAGGTNPEACGQIVRDLIAQKGLDLKVAIITGDDLMGIKDRLADKAPKEMFTNAPFPDVDKIASINAYLGAFAIAKALDAGADIVITGRCVDSAVTLGACIHEFGWKDTDWDALASGSLAGHILECGPQATGGNFTDWQDAGDIANIGYPITTIHSDGSFIVTKPNGTAGIVNVGTVSEQMLYEIGDPQCYVLPDVICDFSDVSVTQTGQNEVTVSPAKGRSAPSHYKTCLTYMDGFRAGTYMSIYGVRAAEKAQKLADAAYVRANRSLRLFNLGPFSEINTEIMGAGSQFGDTRKDADEVVLKIAVKHADVRGVGIFLKETAGLGLATPPGLSGFTGAGRPKPSPVVRLHSFLIDKADVKIMIDIDGDIAAFKDSVPPSQTRAPAPHTPHPIETSCDMTEVPLMKLAWGRSGDKGDKANIGIIARKPEYLSYIWYALTEGFIRKTYAHFEPGDIARYYLPGSHSLNILISDVLGGGGVASLRNDAQAKGYAQILLSKSIPIPKTLAEHL